jgi:hypothetical protein
MPLVYRPAQAHDLTRADALVVASINDLTERHGFGSMATARPPNFQLFSLKDDPDGLWLAEDGGDILGLLGVGYAAICGFSRSYSSTPPSRAVALGMSY